MSLIFEASDTERRVIKSMREELQQRLEREELSVEEVAKRLGLVAEGVQTLVRRQWSFEEAYRVAEALGFDFAAALSTTTNGNGRQAHANGRRPGEPPARAA